VNTKFTELENITLAFGNIGLSQTLSIYQGKLDGYWCLFTYSVVDETDSIM
jgi:hypothetical protein